MPHFPRRVNELLTWSWVRNAYGFPCQSDLDEFIKRITAYPHALSSILSGLILFHSNQQIYCLRPKAKDLGITWVVVLVLVGFFVRSMPYQLTPPCYPQFFNLSFYLSITLSTYLFTYPPITVSVYLSIAISICQSINQYSIDADPRASVGLVNTWHTQMPRRASLAILGDHKTGRSPKISPSFESITFIIFLDKIQYLFHNEL